MKRAILFVLVLALPLAFSGCFKTTAGCGGKCKGGKLGCGKAKVEAKQCGCPKKADCTCKKDERKADCKCPKGTACKCKKAQTCKKAQACTKCPKGQPCKCKKAQTCTKCPKGAVCKCKK